MNVKDKNVENCCAAEIPERSYESGYKFNDDSYR